jgi:hypothetical protein
MLLEQHTGPDDISNIFASLSPEQCSKGYDLVVRLNKDFQQGLEQAPVELKPQLLAQFLDIFTFSEVVHSTLDCSGARCTVHACHSAMLKLGKYKRELDDYDSWHLCVLLAPHFSQQRWCETAMYRAKGRRCVGTIRWLSHNNTDATTARNPEYPSH